MKKYVFLLFLFIIYLLINVKNNNPVISYQNNNNKSVLDFTLSFETGINSNDLVKVFKEYDKDYYINEIYIDDKILDVSCTYLSKCIDEAFNLENEEFKIKYLIKGFKINKVNLIAYKDEIEPFLQKENISYSLK